MKKKIIAAGICAASLAAVLALPASFADAQVSGAPNIFTGRDMTIGSSGPDVIQLQGLLAEFGYLQVPQGVPLGYFGSLTASALAGYQQTLGVPNTGYYGPMTKQAMNIAFASRGWLSLLYPSVYGTSTQS